MKKERIFVGSLLILGAIVLLMNQLGYWGEVNAFSLILGIFLVGVIIKSIFRMNFAGILFPLAFMAILYDEQLGLTAITPWYVLVAALLGSIGLSMIFRKPNKWKEKAHHWTFDEPQIVDVIDDHRMVYQTSFGEGIKYITTQDLESAQLSCHFGAMKVYFDGSTLKDGEATIRLDVSFAGVELYIPKNWQVMNRTNVFLGALDEKNHNERGSLETLVLVGDISFSGVEIIYI
ncbi:MAG: LiaF transmembrane domain-containing protein [Cellulosilyticaceae bacterium]